PSWFRTSRSPAEGRRIKRFLAAIGKARASIRSRVDPPADGITLAARRQSLALMAGVRRRLHLGAHLPHADRARRRGGWSWALRQRLPCAPPAMSAAVWPGPP